MKLFRSKSITASLAVVFALMMASTIAAYNKADWRPITPQEMALDKPKVEADADAEAIFWETRLDDRNSSRLSIEHYVRVKIFTERGRERFSKMDIPFVKGKRITDVYARVVKADGSIVELQNSDIFEREVARRGKSRYMAKSFALPGIEVGAIVEYQYTERIRDDSVTGERLIFQRDIPLQQVTYFIRPFRNMGLRYNWYNLPEGRFVDDKKGFQVATFYDVPSYKEEPYMPPDDEVRRWAFVSYITLGNILEWPRLSSAYGRVLKDLAKPDRAIKAKADELVAGAASDDEKLRRIYNFAQKNIKNISFDNSLSEDEKDKLKIRNAADALKRGMGDLIMVELLFASLAKSAGYEINIVLAGDRRENYFTPDKYPFRSFVEFGGIGVKVRNDWRVFNPGIPYLAFEEVPWYREGLNSMMIGEDGSYIWRLMPKKSYETSNANRKANLTLLADGTLMGEVSVTYSGHQATNRRREEFRDSQATREDNYKDEIKSRISTAEVTNLRIQNFEDTSKPLVYSYTLKVPGFAQRAGRRLIFQPGFFEYGSNAVFSSANRTYNVSFPYPWSEDDDVSIKLPDNFKLDMSTADAPVQVADSGNIASQKIVIEIDQSANQLIYKRNFHFGGGGNTLFPVASYPVIKEMFDRFHTADMHSLSLVADAN